MGLMESLPEFELTLNKALDDLYTVQLETCRAEHRLAKARDPELFNELMSIFLAYKSKYRWAEDIPLMMEKYFFDVLPSLRRHQTEFFYKNLNVTMLSDSKQSARNHEKSFFSLVGSS